MALPSTARKPSTKSTTVQVRFCHDAADDGFPEKGDDVDLRDLHPSSSPDTATFSSIRTSFGSTRASSLTSPQRMGPRDCGTSSRTGSIEGPRPSLVLDLYGSSASMSALPESLSFCISYDGRWIAAWSSARVYLLDAQELPQVRGRSFQLRHRITAVDAVRNGKLVAILSRRCQVEMLRVNPSRPTEPAAIIRSIVLSDEANCIALSPDGGLLAAGSANGIELISLKDTPPSWPDRRTVACDGMDSLAFAPDSKSLIATSYVGSRKITTLVRHPLR
jgi:WD40 repeat protein